MVSTERRDAGQVVQSTASATEPGTVPHLGQDLRAQRRPRDVQQVLPERRLVGLVVEADRLQLIPCHGAGFSVTWAGFCMWGRLVAHKLCMPQTRPMSVPMHAHVDVSDGRAAEWQNCIYKTNVNSSWTVNENKMISVYSMGILRIAKM